MKILIFCPYYPPHIGGLETHADEFNFYLSKKGFDITVFTPRIPIDTYENETIYKEVKIVRFPAFEIISNYPLPKFWSFKFWKMYKVLSNNHYDLIISRTRFFSTSILALIYSKLTKTHWIHIEHGSDFVILSSKFKTFVAKLYDLTLGKLIFRKSNLNISISKAVCKFISRFDNRRSPIIYRGINFDEIDQIPINSKIKQKFKDKIILAWAGRLYKWKGVSDTIKAISVLPKDLKAKLVFLVIGDGEDFSELKKISKKPVYLLGQKTRKETIGILKAADIYIHSSYPGGGLSTSLIEAMYCRCAVIATPHEGANEIITDNVNGLLTKRRDISKAIDRIINISNISPLTLQALTTVKKSFNWDISSKKYSQIITDKRNSQKSKIYENNT